LTIYIVLVLSSFQTDEPKFESIVRLVRGRLQPKISYIYFKHTKKEEIAYGLAIVTRLLNVAHICTVDEMQVVNSQTSVVARQYWPTTV
jgi:hypothetical protein